MTGSASQSEYTSHEHLSCEFMLTSSCNMSCSYCIATNIPGSAMNREIGRKAIDMFVYLAEGGKSIEFIFTGGEPLTQLSILQDLTGYAQKRTHDAGMQAYFVLKTNGTILNRAIIDFIREYAMKVVISIDGILAVHDKHRRMVRGEGTHYIVSQNLIVLIENKIPCVASVTVHPDSSASVLKSIRYLHGLGVEHIDIGPVYGTVEWERLDCQEFTQSLMNVATYMREENDKGKRLEVGPMYQGSEHVGGILSNNWGCHAASTNLAFLPNGQVTGCSALAMLIFQFPELVIGNVFDGLDQVSIDRLIQLAQATAENRLACQSCEVAPNCTGGCLAINYSTSGAALIPPMIYCQTISAIPEAWHRAWGNQ